MAIELNDGYRSRIVRIGAPYDLAVDGSAAAVPPPAPRPRPWYDVSAASGSGHSTPVSGGNGDDDTRWSMPMYRVLAETSRLPGDELIAAATSAAATTIQRILRV